MAQQYDQLHSRRDKRMQQKLARKRSRRRWLTALALLSVCVLMAVVLLLPEPQEPENVSTQPSASTSAPAPTQPQTVINLSVGGDVNVTDRVVAAGLDNGRYDFDRVFQDVAGLFAQSQVSLVNFEGNLSGAPFGTASTSAPQELMQSLAAAGVDLVQMANSCTVNNGLTGLKSTLQGIRSAGLEPLGAFSSLQERENTQGFTIRNVGGIRVAFVAFTKGVGSLGLPSGSEKLVNLLYKDYSSTYQQVDEEGITALLQAIRAQKPDVTIAMLHWGSEYNDMISASQEKIVKLMLDGGVDAILGTHPHYVQQVQYDKNAGTVVAYSLGDLLGDAQKAGTNYSIVLQLQITRDNRTGETRITDCQYVPVYILTPEADGVPLQVVRLREAIAMYENNHVSRVSQQTYENMKYALGRIEARVEG